MPSVISLTPAHQLKCIVTTENSKKLDAMNEG